MKRTVLIGLIILAMLLGTVAYRAGQKLEWDPVNMKVICYFRFKAGFTAP